MKPYSIIIFMICLNISCYLLVEMEVFSVSSYPEGYTGPETIMETFKFGEISLTDIFLLGTGGILAGIMMLITRQYVFASIALVIWVIGIVLKPVGWVIVGFPLMVNSLLLMSGVSSTLATALQLTISAFYFFIFFIFIIEIASQRQLT